MASKKPVKVTPRGVIGQPSKKLEQTSNKLEVLMLQYYTNGGTQNGLLRMARYMYQEYINS